MLPTEKDIHPYFRAIIVDEAVAAPGDDTMDLQVGCLGGALGIPLLFFALMLVDRPGLLSLFLFLVNLGVFAVVMWLHHQAWVRARVERLRIAIDKLAGQEHRWTEAQKAYLQLLSTLCGHRLVEQPAARTVLQQANLLVDYAIRIDALRKHLKPPRMSSIDEEYSRIQTKLAQMEDPVARRALEDSLQILQERMRGIRQSKARLQQLDALEELIVQLLKILHEFSLRLGTLEAPGTDVRLIYERLSELQSEARAIEQALQELQEMDADEQQRTDLAAEP